MLKNIKSKLVRSPLLVGGLSLGQKHRFNSQPYLSLVRRTTTRTIPHNLLLQEEQRRKSSLMQGLEEDTRPAAPEPKKDAAAAADGTRGRRGSMDEDVAYTGGPLAPPAGQAKMLAAMEMASLKVRLLLGVRAAWAQGLGSAVLG